jgi:predicted Zn-dependent protease
MGLCVLGLPEVAPGKRDVVLAAGAAAWTLANQRPAEAAAAYRELLAKYPNEPGVRYAHGLYLLEADMAAALAEFQEEARNNPAHWPSLLMIASLEVRQGQTEPAIEGLRQALKLMPARQRWIAHTELGRAHMSADRLDAAIAELETGMRLMPSNASVRFLLAQAYRQAGRTEEAEKQNIEFRKLRSRQDPLAVPGLTAR